MQKNEASNDSTSPPRRPGQGGWFVILYRRGPSWIAGRPMIEQPMDRHLAYMKEVCTRTDVEYAGGFLDEEAGGMMMLRAADLATAEAIIENDPAIREGLMLGIVRPFYMMFGSADRRDCDKANASQAAENLDAVRRLFTAVSGRADRSDAGARRAAYAKLYDEAVVIHEAPSLPYGGEYQGPNAVASHASAYRAAWDGLQSVDERTLAPLLLADHERVVVLWRHRAQAEGGTASFEMPVVGVYEMKNSRITDSRMYHFDVAATRDFLDRASSAKEPAAP